MFAIARYNQEAVFAAVYGRFPPSKEKTYGSLYFR
jgi:hypothetical protein